MVNETPRRQVNSNPLPLYHQIASIIRDQIDTGTWSVGDRIPSESSLASYFNVSVMTVRGALALLAEQGQVDRRQGSGTFVSAHAEQRSVELTVPLEAIAQPVAELEVRGVSINEVLAPAGIRQELGLAADEKCIEVRRTRSAQSMPVTYAITYMPMWLGEGLELDELHDSLMVDLLESKGVHFSGARQTITASLADPDTAAVLQLEVAEPVMVVTRYYELDTNQVGYIAVIRHSSRNLRYEVRLRRENVEPRRWRRQD